jgi:hypothetical protein
MILAELHIPVNRKLGTCDSCPDRFTCFTSDEIVIRADKQIENIQSAFIINMEAEFTFNYLFIRRCFDNFDIKHSVFCGGRSVYVSEYSIVEDFPARKIVIKSKIPA